MTQIGACGRQTDSGQPDLNDLPAFPETAPLTRANWENVAGRIDELHAPLAELSFYPLFCWRGAEAVALSRIGSLLLVFFADGERQVMAVELAGAGRTGDQYDRLAEIARDRPIRFLSSRTALALEAEMSARGFDVIFDRNNSDYVYSATRLVSLELSEYRDKRREARRFERRNAPVVRDGTLADPWARRHLEEAFDRWLAAKYVSDGSAPEAVIVERQGVAAWPCDTSASQVRVFCLEVAGEPVGVSVVEPMWDATWMGLVLKCDPRLAGATPLLRQHVARAIGVAARGSRGLLDVQQDEGIADFRDAKRSSGRLGLEPTVRSDGEDRERGNDMLRLNAGGFPARVRARGPRLRRSESK